MKNLTDSEVERLKDILFKWAGSDNTQEWVNATNALIRIGEISTQEAQAEAIKYLNKVTAAMEKEEQEGGKK